LDIGGVRVMVELRWAWLEAAGVGEMVLGWGRERTEMRLVDGGRGSGMWMNRGGG